MLVAACKHWWWTLARSLMIYCKIVYLTDKNTYGQYGRNGPVALRGRHTARITNQNYRNACNAKTVAQKPITDICHFAIADRAAIFSLAVFKTKRLRRKASADHPDGY